MLKIIVTKKPDNYNGNGYIKFPENNLSPQDIVNWSKIYNELGKTHDYIIITFSSLLIESIDTWNEYYNHNTQIKYYLEEQEISENELYKIYNFLYDDGYKILNKLKISIKKGGKK